MNKYRIAYGMDTDSLEDPDQLVLLTLPGKCADMNSDDLGLYINTYWGDPNVQSQPLVGMSDVIDALRLVLAASDVDAKEQTDIVAHLLSAMGNNS